MYRDHNISFLGVRTPFLQTLDEPAGPGGPGNRGKGEPGKGWEEGETTRRYITLLTRLGIFFLSGSASSRKFSASFGMFICTVVYGWNILTTLAWKLKRLLG
jgi:hypothetical protein